MKPDHLLFIGGVKVGTIHNLELDWPHYLGDFEPGPEFDAFKDLFAKMCTSNDQRQNDLFELYLEQLFEIGIEIRSLENKVLFKRKGAVTSKDIFIIFICDNKLSFRPLSR